ncbi:MAG: hypothetical protein O3A46_15170 [Candidatus Poribacteria bacterium]|nr:hypothetical protein [Candidatus Poribacteria bacterium]
MATLEIATICRTLADLGLDATAHAETVRSFTDAAMSDDRRKRLVVEAQVDYLLEMYARLDEAELTLERSVRLSADEYTALYNEFALLVVEQVKSSYLTLKAAEAVGLFNDETRELTLLTQEWASFDRNDESFDHPVFHALADAAERAYAKGDVEEGGFGE